MEGGAVNLCLPTKLPIPEIMVDLMTVMFSNIAFLSNSHLLAGLIF